jgi:magnesium-transporting ATPase (P-type)
MSVERINMIDTTFPADQLSCNLEIQNKLWDCAILNCDAHMQMSGTEYKPVGSPVEVGILNLLLSSGVSVQEKLVERERDHILHLWIPFSSDRKRMTVAY